MAMVLLDSHTLELSGDNLDYYSTVPLASSNLYRFGSEKYCSQSRFAKGQ